MKTKVQHGEYWLGVYGLARKYDLCFQVFDIEDERMQDLVGVILGQIVHETTRPTAHQCWVGPTFGTHPSRSAGIYSELEFVNVAGDMKKIAERFDQLLRELTVVVRTYELKVVAQENVVVQEKVPA